MSTFSSASSLVSAAGSMNAGTSVLNLVTAIGSASPGGSKVASCFSSPSMESARELISWTLPASTWSTKNGWYGTRLRSSGRPVTNEITRFTASSARTNQMNRLPRGIMGGLDGAGLPRPSGAGSTRQPDSVLRGGGGGGLGGRVGSQTANGTPLAATRERLLRPPAAMPRAVPAAGQFGTVWEDG